MKKRFAFLAALFLTAAIACLQAQETGTASKTLAAVSRALTNREYAKAFSYVEFLVKLRRDDAMSEEAIAICGKAAELYSQDLLAKKRWQEIADLGARLSGAPLAVQERANAPILRATAELTAQEARKRAALAAAKADSAVSVGPAPPIVVDRSVSRSAPSENVSADLRLDFESFREATFRREARWRTRFAVLVGAIVPCALTCLAAVFLGAPADSIRRGRAHPRSPGIFFAAYPPSGSKNETRNIEEICESFSGAEIEALTRTCSSLGFRIDAHTERPNNSRRVSRLVYAISRNVGYSHSAASVFAAGGLIRDLGFLSVEAAVFRSAAADEGDVAEIRRHVEGVETFLLLIDERLRDVFVEGIALHHENLDGSGYAAIASAKRIPYLARVLRVAESYVALVSPSPYHPMKFAPEAIDELRSLPKRYDSSLLAALAVEV